MRSRSAFAAASAVDSAWKAAEALDEIIVAWRAEVSARAMQSMMACKRTRDTGITSSGWPMCKLEMANAPDIEEDEALPAPPCMTVLTPASLEFNPKPPNRTPNP